MLAAVLLLALVAPVPLPPAEGERAGDRAQLQESVTAPREPDHGVAETPPPRRPRPGEELEPGLHGAALPLVSYGSDVGLQLGGAAYLYGTDRHGERESWGALGVAWTSHGPRSLELKGELLRLFGTSLRTFVQVKGAIDTSAPYWGEGASLRAGVAAGAGAPPPEYRYQSVGPWLSAVLRGSVAGPFGWWTRLRYTEVAVEQPSALLARSAPRGVLGGATALAHLGIAWDTREGGASPRHGLLADASVFGAPAGLSSYGFGGVNVGARGYLALAADVVLALRGFYDLKLGGVPFFERALFEGLGYGEGLGGAGTIRGLARDRLMGEEKALVGAELRMWLAGTRLLGHPQAWGVSVGGDAGRARDRGTAPVLGAGGFVGGRLLWDRAVVVRFEVGYAGQDALGYYLSFDEPF
ncbi:MAG: hypothetical protein ACJ79E_10950 [Anaeromyxobacteraceae bacterium]